MKNRVNCMNEVQKIKQRHDMDALLRVLAPKMEANVQARRRREKRAWAEGEYLTKTGQVLRVV